MGLFSRSKDNSANSSSTSLDKSKPPPTTNTYTVPPPGVKPTKKWNYDENQLAQVSSRASARKANEHAEGATIRT